MSILTRTCGPQHWDEKERVRQKETADARANLAEVGCSEGGHSSKERVMAIVFMMVIMMVMMIVLVMVMVRNRRTRSLGFVCDRGSECA